MERFFGRGTRERDGSARQDRSGVYVQRVLVGYLLFRFRRNLEAGDGKVSQAQGSGDGIDNNPKVIETAGRVLLGPKSVIAP